MSRASRLSLGLAVSLALTGAARAQSYKAFDAAGATTSAERLVLCDTSLFLAARPDLNSRRIVAPRQNRMAALLLPPQFVSGGQMFSDRDERLMGRLVDQRQVTVRDIAEAQATKGRAMIDLYRTSRHIDHPFTVRQEHTCRAFAKTYGVRGGF
jgi:hypothetical protein